MYIELEINSTMYVSKYVQRKKKIICIENDNDFVDFERNEDRAIVFLKWTDFTYFALLRKDMHFSEI